MRKKYEVIGLGGTFDHLHIGHEHFIRFAHQHGKHLHIGVTADKLNRSKPLSHLIQPLDIRQKQIKHFCKVNKISCSISTLNDVYGPTVQADTKIKALAVTDNTVQGGEKINQVRRAAELKELPIHVCNLLTDEEGQIISSERIRRGEINRQGQIYQSLFKEDLIINKKARQALSVAQGMIITQPSEKRGLVCVVGDGSLNIFLNKGWEFDIGVYDLVTRRRPINLRQLTKLKPNIEVFNPAGQITTQLVAAILQHPHLLRVKGEEDLAAAALMMLMPLGTKIYYGQPGSGIVEMVVTETRKNNFFQLLKGE